MCSVPSHCVLLQVILGDDGCKEETDCVENWAESQQEVSLGISQEADSLRASDSPGPQVGTIVSLGLSLYFLEGCC